MLNTTNTSNNNRNTNQLLVPQAENALEQMKQEIAQEFGVTLGADTTARMNGSVGGEMTKRLIALGQQALIEKQNNKTLH
jgi:hypothetical protein